MATRKRLSDLVREEVKKQSDDDASSSQTTPKKTKRQPAKGLKSEVAAKSTAKSSTATKQKTSETAAKLKTKLADLESQNKTLTADNAKLLTKVSELEGQLASTEQVAKDLKAAIAKQKSMQLTLDEAKQDALKLAQENQKLLDQIKALETQQPSVPQDTSIAPVKSAPTTPAPPVRVSQNRVIHRTAARSSQPVIYKATAKKPFSRPIVPSRMPPQRVVQNSDEFDTWCYD